MFKDKEAKSPGLDNSLPLFPNPPGFLYALAYNSVWERKSR